MLHTLFETKILHQFLFFLICGEYRLLKKEKKESKCSKKEKEDNCPMGRCPQKKQVWIQ
jgi:hypothetical protein